LKSVDGFDVLVIEVRVVRREEEERGRAKFLCRQQMDHANWLNQEMV